jgi:hypothetical protein
MESVVRVVAKAEPLPVARGLRRGRARANGGGRGQGGRHEVGRDGSERLTIATVLVKEICPFTRVVNVETLSLWRTGCRAAARMPPASDDRGPKGPLAARVVVRPRRDGGAAGSLPACTSHRTARPHGTGWRSTPASGGRPGSTALAPPAHAPALTALKRHARRDSRGRRSSRHGERGSRDADVRLAGKRLGRQAQPRVRAGA